jgi:hypothetical protein
MSGLGRDDHLSAGGKQAFEYRVLVPAEDGYLKTYREERKRLAKANAGKRGALERALAQAEREVGRLVDGFALGIISDDEARKRLPEARQRRDATKADLAAIGLAMKVVELHPTTVTHYLAAIDDLSTTLSRRVVEGDEQVASALRELISAVVIHPAGKEEPKIEVTGRLAQLTSAPDLFPQQTLWPTVVAGARIVHSRHQAETDDRVLGFVFTLPRLRAR